MRIDTHERYKNDLVFQTIVDLLYHQLVAHEYTPTELREAVMMAALKFETLHVRPMFINRETGEVTYGARFPGKETVNLWQT